MLKVTPFNERQQRLGGKFIDFFGWNLPVQFTSIPTEHKAVREKAGVFDISHMGQAYVEGDKAEDFLQLLITNDLNKASLGKGLYAHLLNPRGTVIDDIYVFRIEEKKFLLIVNASRRETDIAWIKNRLAEDFSGSSDVSITEDPDAAGLALQGPLAAEILGGICPEAVALTRNGIGKFDLASGSCFISRTGYTGEDGFEIFGQTAPLFQIWDAIFKDTVDRKASPCGLGARDTLRTEVAYPLYGHELDENHTPLEAGLGWVVKLDKPNFIGREALLQQKRDGLKVKLAGFKVEKGGVARPEALIFSKEKEVGVVASGTFSPTLGYSIGMCYLPIDLAAEGTPLKITQGPREFFAATVRLPFYKKAK